MKKKILITFIIIFLLIGIGLIVFFATKKNNSIDSKKDGKSMIIKIPSISDEGVTKYVEKKYEGEEVPTKVLEMIDSLKLTEEMIPEGTGFEMAHFIDYQDKDKKISYVLTGHPYLCDMETRKCYKSEMDLNEIMYDYNPQYNIINVKISIALPDNQYKYIEYKDDKVPKHIKRIINNLEFDTEKIPDNIGFAGMNSIDITTEEKEYRYILTFHPKLCEIRTKACFTSSEDLNELFK